MPTMIIRIPFEVSLEHYPPGTTYEQACNEEAQNLRDHAYGLDEFAFNNDFEVEVEL